MKPYDELTLEEKQELVRLGIRLWKNGNIEYAVFDEVDLVVQHTLMKYVKESKNLTYFITPELHQGADIMKVLRELPEFKELSGSKTSKN